MSKIMNISVDRIIKNRALGIRKQIEELKDDS